MAGAPTTFQFPQGQQAIVSAWVINLSALMLEVTSGPLQLLCGPAQTIVVPVSNQAIVVQGINIGSGGSGDMAAVTYLDPDAAQLLTPTAGSALSQAGSVAVSLPAPTSSSAVQIPGTGSLGIPGTGSAMLVYSAWLTVSGTGDANIADSTGKLILTAIVGGSGDVATSAVNGGGLPVVGPLSLTSAGVAANGGVWFT